jgi:hypothetical protein
MPGNGKAVIRRVLNKMFSVGVPQTPPKILPSLANKSTEYTPETTIAGTVNLKAHYRNSHTLLVLRFDLESFFFFSLANPR